MGRGADDLTSESDLTRRGLLQRKITDSDEALDFEASDEATAQESGKAIDIPGNQLLPDDIDTDSTRRNILRQSILGGEEADAELSEVMDDVARIERENLLLEAKKIALQVEYYDPEGAESRFNDFLEWRQQQLEQEEEAEKELLEYTSHYSEERKLLESEGINRFEKGSPGYDALNNWPLYLKEYSVRIQPTGNQLLIDEGKAYAFSVAVNRYDKWNKEGNKRHQQTLEKGFAASEAEAKEMAAAIIEKEMDKFWSDLREKHEQYTKDHPEEDPSLEIEKKKQEMEANKKILAEREKREALLEGLDFSNLSIDRITNERYGNTYDRFVRFANMPLLMEQDLSHLKRETIDNFDIITYERDGLVEAVVFHEGKPYAASTIPEYEGRGHEVVKTDVHGSMATINTEPCALTDGDERDVSRHTEERLKEVMGDQYKTTASQRLGRILFLERRLEIDAMEERREETRREIEEEERQKMLVFRVEERRSELVAAIKDSIKEELAEKALSRLEE